MEYPNPTHGVTNLDISHQQGNDVRSIHTYISHELSEPAVQELVRIVEDAIVAAVRAYVKP